MAHELWIETASGAASMFYVGQTPWHGLGKALDSPATAAEAIKASNLGWNVWKEQLYVKQGDKHIQVNNRFAIMRPKQGNESDDVALGIVGKEYVPLQNSEAFAFFDHIVGRNEAIYHTAGALGKGERIWVLAKLPDSIQVVGDDISDKYLLLSNSHDGTSSVQIKFTPIRVVCNNTLTMALSQGDTIRIPHNRDMDTLLKQSERTLGVINRRFNDIEKVFKAMAGQQINKEQLETYLAKVFPFPKDSQDENGQKRASDNRSLAEYLFDQGTGNRQHGVAGTLWAAYNGVTELIDHRITKQTRENKLNSIWFGDGYLIKARAYRLAEGLLKAA